MLNVNACFFCIFLYFVCHKEMLYKARIFFFIIFYVLSCASSSCVYHMCLQLFCIYIESFVSVLVFQHVAAADQLYTYLIMGTIDFYNVLPFYFINIYIHVCTCMFFLF
jgi:hypothetical protein